MGSDLQIDTIYKNVSKKLYNLLDMMKMFVDYYLITRMKQILAIKSKILIYL